MEKCNFYGVKNRASTNLKKVNLHLYISLRKRHTYKTGIFVLRNQTAATKFLFLLSRSFSKVINTSKLEMPKIVSVETL
jgi:hypothetical protein